MNVKTRSVIARISDWTFFDPNDISDWIALLGCIAIAICGVIRIIFIWST